VIHYHGTPITPNSVIRQLAGSCFCVRYGEHRQVAIVHEIGQAAMLDNGAFSVWTKGRSADWPGYYAWAEPWLEFPTTWAVIPDVIDGDEQANDELVAEWPYGERGAPVWHMHESVDRLLRLCAAWPRVCIGSSGEYRIVGSARWRRRMEQAMDSLIGSGPVPVWLHGLRMMSQAGSDYPLASVDSTDIARNHAGNRTRNGPRKDPVAMATRWDSKQNPARWPPRGVER